MKVRLTVVFDQGHEIDGERELQLECGSRDILAWEKAGPNRAAAQVVLLSQFKIDDLYALAFATMRRRGLWSGAEKDLREHSEIDLGWTSAPEAEATEPESEEDRPTRADHSSGE